MVACGKRFLICADGGEDAWRVPWWRIKAGIDATRTWPTEGVTRPWPNDTVMSPEVKAKVDALWSRLGIET